MDDGLDKLKAAGGDVLNVTSQTASKLESMYQRSGIEKGRMRFLSDWEKTIGEEFKLMIVNTSKTDQYKDAKFMQPAILVFNNTFELIYSWKKEGNGNPFGRPYPASLFPVLIQHAKATAEGVSLPVIPKDKLNAISYQGLSSVPRALCGCGCAIV